jgi:heme-degrading monooxygenase HmoA
MKHAEAEVLALAYVFTEAVTVINVFTVDKARQQELIDLLTRATEEWVRHAPGFLGARLHRSVDGARVALYAEWRSNWDYQAMRRDPGPRVYLSRALAIAQIESGVYEAVQTFVPWVPAS